MPIYSIAAEEFHVLRHLQLVEAAAAALKHFIDSITSATLERSLGPTAAAAAAAAAAAEAAADVVQQFLISCRL